MKYIKNYNKYEPMNEGFVDNIKKMAYIGILTAPMLFGNSAIAQEYDEIYPSLDTITKTEIKRAVENNKDFRIGPFRMGMTFEEFTSRFKETSNLYDLYDGKTYKILDGDEFFTSKGYKGVKIRNVMINSEIPISAHLTFYNNKLFQIIVDGDRKLLDILKSYKSDGTIKVREYKEYEYTNFIIYTISDLDSMYEIDIKKAEEIRKKEKEDRRNKNRIDVLGN